ncbi:MAG TPA: hypothetical protein VNH11_27955 [Pirellulales bacterium]|nr:hypothetical protein [Pirellulales bacterium]
MTDPELDGVTVTVSKPRCYKPGEAYSCHILVYPLAEGGYSAYCLALPEVAAQGATSQEAVAKVIEGFRETVLRCRAAQQPIPWIPWDKVEVPNLPGARELGPTVEFPVDPEA